MLSTIFKCQDVKHTISAYIKCQKVLFDLFRVNSPLLIEQIARGILKYSGAESSVLVGQGSGSYLLLSHLLQLDSQV